MSVIITKIGDVVNPLIGRYGSLAAFRDAMKAEGVVVSDNTIRGWTRGARLTRPAHIIAVTRLSGKTSDEVLRAALSPEEEEDLFSGEAADGFEE